MCKSELWTRYSTHWGNLSAQGKLEDILDQNYSQYQGKAARELHQGP